MEPSTILGAVFGTFLSKLLPESVLTMTLALIFFFLGQRMVRGPGNEAIRSHTLSDLTLFDSGFE